MPGLRTTLTLRALAAAALVASSLSLAPGPARGQLPGGGDITVYRDRFGVPHVEAPSLQGLSYATGYLMAKDRLFEMDVIRKLGQGRLSELIGPSMLDADRYTRREFLLTADIAGQWNALTAEQRSLFQAYTDGVNKGATEVLANPATTPTLFAALGDVWEPWKPTDSLVVSMVFTEVTFGGEGAAGELDNAHLLAQLQSSLGPEEGLRTFDDLVPPVTADAPTVIAKGEGPPPPASGGSAVAQPPPSQLDLVRLPGLPVAAQSLDNELATVRRVLAQAHIPVPKIGSFGAALAGSRTASGGGLLLGSPQAGLAAPPIFYEIGWHLSGVGDCEGFTVPGLGPVIGIGWCNQHAWTLVAGNMGDQADLYVERLDPANPHRYLFDGAWHDTVQRSTTYIVKSPIGCPVNGVPAPCPPQVVNETYDYTGHGAISAVDATDHVGFAYRRAQTGVFLRSLYGVAAWNQSKNLSDFMAGTDAFTATYNLLYADSAGHIAYRFTGLQPARPGTDRRLPVPGTGEAEWQGFLTQCQMPNVTDPASGYLAVNQGTESKPISWWPDSSGVTVGAVSRVGHDQELLAPLRGAGLSTLQALDKRYLEQDDPYAALFYPLFRHALASSSDPRLTQALALLDAWRAGGFTRTDADNDGKEDHPGLSIFELDDIDYTPPTDGFQVPLADALVSAVLGPATGGKPLGTTQAELSVVYDALTGRTGHRFVADPDAVIRAAVTSVLDKLTKTYGTADMGTWHQAFPTEPFQGIEPVEPPPVKGMDHGTYSQVVDPAAGAGVNVEPPGNVAADSAVAVAQIEAGAPPAHYADQRKLYEAYGFKPMRMAPAQYRADPEEVLHLDDGGAYGSDTTLEYRSRVDPCRSAPTAVAGERAVAPVLSRGSRLPATGSGWPGPAGALALLSVAVLGRGVIRRRAW